MDRLWVRLEIEGECIVWGGALSSHGYGLIKDGTKPVRTHRVMWEAARGPIPAGLEVDHLCRNRRCCRLDHLELVTHAENMRRRRQRDRPASSSHLHPCRDGGLPMTSHEERARYLRDARRQLRGAIRSIGKAKHTLPLGAEDDVLRLLQLQLRSRDLDLGAAISRALDAGARSRVGEVEMGVAS